MLLYIAITAVAVVYFICGYLYGRRKHADEKRQMVTAFNAILESFGHRIV
jgi:hypothetical protein